MSLFLCVSQRSTLLQRQKSLVFSSCLAIKKQEALFSFRGAPQRKQWGPSWIQRIKVLGKCTCPTPWSLFRWSIWGIAARRPQAPSQDGLRGAEAVVRARSM